jgi:hypothetical protein
MKRRIVSCAVWRRAVCSNSLDQISKDALLIFYFVLLLVRKYIQCYLSLTASVV